MFRHVMDHHSRKHPEFLAIAVGSTKEFIDSGNGKAFCLSYYTHEDAEEPNYKSNNEEWFKTLEEAYRAFLVRKNGDGFTTASTLTMNAMAEHVVDELIEVVGDIDGQYIDDASDLKPVKFSPLQIELQVARLEERDALLDPAILIDIVKHRSNLIA